jgi:hypothetical protein
MVHEFFTVPYTDYGTSHTVNKYAEITALFDYEAKNSREMDFDCSFASN